MANFSTLMQQVRQCSLCQDNLPLLAKPILQASVNAKILIAGQAPGVKAHNSGVPFDDASGKRLRQWLGLNSEQFYDPELIAILPMGFCYPGKGKSGDLAPRPECAPAWRQQLLDQMSQIKLTVIIGQYAIKWHKPQFKGTVTAAVEQSLQQLADGCDNNTLVLPHPSPRNNIWLKKHLWFEQQLLPLLQKKISQLI
ncbi:uracil-DNA glycosylase family protein [Rheinheimera sp. WS51]|uniref:uracil-DNA glycosylase family protein n=1 Tax=Rheinheimera sp. WS51 TaxID=3425886 RepID=UPI003D9056D9